MLNLIKSVTNDERCVKFGINWFPNIQFCMKASFLSLILLRNPNILKFIKVSHIMKTLMFS